MPFTHANTSWASGQRPTADDMNRIEANAEAGAKPAVTAQRVDGLTQVNDVAGVYPVTQPAHISKTGRVKVSIVATYFNSSGATKVVAMAPARNNILLGGEPTVGTVLNNSYISLVMFYVDATPTIGVSYNYGFRHRVTVAPGVQLVVNNTTVEDI